MDQEGQSGLSWFCTNVETCPTGPSRSRMETHAYAITAVSTVSEMTFALLIIIMYIHVYRFTG